MDSRATDERIAREALKGLEELPTYERRVQIVANALEDARAREGTRIMADQFRCVRDILQKP